MYAKFYLKSKKNELKIKIESILKFCKNTKKKPLLKDTPTIFLFFKDENEVWHQGRMRGPRNGHKHPRFRDLLRFTALVHYAMTRNKNLKLLESLQRKECNIAVSATNVY